MPSSVACVIETARGWTWCSSPRLASQRPTSSGASLPCSVATVRSLTPAKRSGAPHSSTFRCAVSAQITASCGLVSASSERTFAPVPLKTKNGSRIGAEVAAEHLGRALGPGVGAVGAGVALVGAGDRLDHLGVGAGVVVGGEVVKAGHVSPSSTALSRSASTLTVGSVATWSWAPGMYSTVSLSWKYSTPNADRIAPPGPPGLGNEERRSAGVRSRAVRPRMPLRSPGGAVQTGTGSPGWRPGAAWPCADAPAAAFEVRTGLNARRETAGR